MFRISFSHCKTFLYNKKRIMVMSLLMNPILGIMGLTTGMLTFLMNTLGLMFLLVFNFKYARFILSFCRAAQIVRMGQDQPRHFCSIKSVRFS